MTDVFLPMLWGYCVVTSIGLALHADETPALRTEDLTYIAIFAVIIVVSGSLDLAQRRTPGLRR